LRPACWGKSSSAFRAWSAARYRRRRSSTSSHRSNLSCFQTDTARDRRLRRSLSSLSEYPLRFSTPPPTPPRRGEGRSGPWRLRPKLFTPLPASSCRGEKWQWHLHPSFHPRLSRVTGTLFPSPARGGVRGGGNDLGRDDRTMRLCRSTKSQRLCLGSGTASAIGPPSPDGSVESLCQRYTGRGGGGVTS